MLCSNTSIIHHTSEYADVSHTKVQYVCSQWLYKSSFGVKNLVWSLLCNVKRLACGRHLRGKEAGRALNEAILKGQKHRINCDCWGNATHRLTMAHFLKKNRFGYVGILPDNDL